MKSKKLNTKTKILVLGGSKGIGKSISDLVKKNYKQVKSFSSKDVDTSDLSSVKKFVKNNKSTDVIVLNSGGPPNLKFEKIDEKIWYKYFIIGKWIIQNPNPYRHISISKERVKL